MTTATRNRSGLDAPAPERYGIARDCYEVACTALLLRRKAQGEGFEDTNAPARHAVTLHRISGQLHRISERECNEDLTCEACRGSGDDGNHHTRGSVKPCRRCKGDGRTTGPRKARLRAQVEEIATHYGLRAYFQTDPRGCAVYLVPAEIIPTGARDLMRYDYGQPEQMTDGYTPPLVGTLAELQARWVDSNYTRGHAVVRLGR